METLQELDLQQSYASITVTDFTNVNAVISQILEAAAYCHQEQIYRLAIYVPQSPGRLLTTFQVYRIVTQMDKNWDRRCIVAVIVGYKPSELEEFGLLVARNRGILMRLFTDADEGRLWLQQMAL